MDKKESVKMMHCAANISEKILFDETGAPRSDENIRFIMQAVNQAVQAAVSPSFEDIFKIIACLKKDGVKSNA